MVNSFSPFGFRQLRMYEGVQPTWGAEQLLVQSTDGLPIFTGDPVITSTGAPGTGGFGQYVMSGSTALQTTYTSTGQLGPAIRGIFLGCEYYNSAVGRIVWSSFWPGSGGAGVSSAVDVRALVAVDPRILWIVQASTGATFASSQIGSGLQLLTLSSQGNTTTGISNCFVGSTTGSITLITNSSTIAPFQLVDFYSQYAPPGGGGYPGLGTAFSSIAMITGSPIVNGTDNTNPGQILVVRITNLGPAWQT
jgi:hypothetical protein